MSIFWGTVMYVHCPTWIFIFDADQAQINSSEFYVRTCFVCTSSIWRSILGYTPPPPSHTFYPLVDALSREINTIDFSLWPGADGLNTAYSNIIQIPPYKGTARMRQPADKLVGNSYQCACTVERHWQHQLYVLTCAEHDWFVDSVYCVHTVERHWQGGR